MMKNIGIDGSNLKQGGGVTHLVELLRVAEPADFGIGRVTVWSNKKTLATIHDRVWLDKVALPELEGGQLRRAFWQRFELEKLLRRHQCELLFVPGGNYPGAFRPFVTMSRNMLPFEERERARYGVTTARLRLEILKVVQGRSFRRADGVIFLTDYARREVEAVVGALSGKVATIPHGAVHEAGVARPAFREISACSEMDPFRIVYVSDVSPYKHNLVVAKAVEALRASEGWPLRLDLIGPPTYEASVQELKEYLQARDPNGAWVKYHGARPRSELPSFIDQADVGVFASSCENMPNVLLEKMVRGVPIACSDRGPMEEILGEGGVYFDPESSESIGVALRRLIRAPALRARCADTARERAQAYSWARCANETFGFIQSFLH